MAPKKGRRARRGDDDSDDDLKTQASAGTEAAEAENPPANQKKTSKKKQAKKKGKVVDWSDGEADPITAEADSEELPGKPSAANGGFAALVEDAEEEDGPPAVLQSKPKKGRKKPAASFAALSQEEEDPEAEAEEEYEAALQPSLTRKDSGKSAARFAALSLAEDPEAEAEEGGSEQQVEPEEDTGKSAASFAALSLADDPEAEAEEEAGPSPQRAAAGFAALETEENGEAPEGVGGAEEAAAPAAKAQPAKKGKKGKGKGKSKFDLEDDFALPPPEVQVASVVSVQQHPNADKLKVCSVDTGSVTVKVVTNAVTVEEGMKVAFAGIGCTTPGSGIKIEQTTLRGVESFGMLCSAFDLGWVDEPDGALVQLPGSAEDGSKVPAAPMEGALCGAAASTAANGAGKKDKKKKGKKDVGFADLEEEEEEVSQQTDEPEEPPSKRPGKKKKKGGSDAAAAAFAALGIEEEGEPLESAAASQAAEEGPAANGHSLESEEVGPSGVDGQANGETPELLFGAKRKKSKAKAFDPDAIIATAAGGESPMDLLPEAAPVEEAQLPVEKKKKGKKKAVFDVDAMLAEATSEAPAAGGEPPASVQEEAASAAPADANEASTADASAEAPQEEALGRKGKKKKGKGEAADEDLDALLAQFGVNTDAAADGKQGKKKKKGKAAAEEEPKAAALESEAAAETAEVATAGTAEVATAEQPGATEQPSSSATAAEAGEDAEADAEGDAEGDDAADADGKGLTAAQKKKQKKKAKEKAKKGGGKEDEEPGAATAAAKKGGKKESAAVRKLREEMERQRAAQEAAAKAEEERRRKEEEDARLVEEEAARKEEDRKRRKEEKTKQRAELKRQGLLKTGREKQEAERLAAMREQFLRNNPGVELPPVGEPQQKKKVVYGRKKPGVRRQESGISEEGQQEEAEAAAQQQAEEARLQQEQEEREQAEQEARAKAEEEAASAAAAAAAVAAAAAEAADDSDDMGWEDLDEDQIKLPGQEATQEEEEEEEEDAEEEMPQAEALPNGKAKAAEVKAPEAKKPRIEQPKAAAAVPAGKQEAEEAEDDAEEEEEESSEEGSGSEDEEDESSEEDSSTEYSESEDESLDSEDAREERLQAARAARAEKLKAARQAGSAEDLRSPICCILGHVDTGKTKLLDNIRRTSVQEGEAGGITQQIGATYVPGEAIRTRTEPVRKGRDFGLKLPGLLIIDTPGHESFTNLRSRGSSLCDIAILVVDIMHGLEPQTIESINLLKQKKTPFIVALNKVDRLFEWSSQANAGIQDSLAAQKPHVGAEFEKNLQRATLNLNEQGLNVALYWKNPDPRKYVNIVPTSAITGEGIPDMLQLVVQLTQKMMAERLMYISELQCTVLEVKVIEGLGTTIDVVLVNGVLHEGDQIVLCGLQGAIVTTIRSLLTPHPLKELRVRGSYLHHKEIKAAQGIKIAAQNLENAVAGTQMLVVQKGDSVEDLKEEVMGDMVDIFKSVDKSGEGVCVQASTLGSLEALLEFLRSDAVRIPVSGINLGPVHKRDVMRASTMLEKGRRKFAVILAFDVPVTREAQEQATSTGVRIFTADIIYHLFDQFSAYLKHAKEEEQQAAAAEAVFPVILRILPTCIFNTKDPIVLGCEIDEGIAKVGTPLCVPSKGGFLLGKISSMELNHKPVDIARRGDSIALKIEATTAEESAKLYGRHFDFKDNLVSKISRKSIDLLKMHFKDDLARDDWRLVVKLKKMFGID